jgi:hypothetical protein
MPIRMNIVCSRCNQMFSGYSEYSAEKEFNLHECVKDGRSLEDLTQEELMDIITSDDQAKREAEIWAAREEDKCH